MLIVALLLIFLCKELLLVAPNTDLTYQQLIEKISKQLKSQNIDQHPQVIGSKEKHIFEANYIKEPQQLQTTPILVSGAFEHILTNSHDTIDVIQLPSNPLLTYTPQIIEPSIHTNSLVKYDSENSKQIAKSKKRPSETELPQQIELYNSQPESKEDLTLTPKSKKYKSTSNANYAQNNNILPSAQLAPSVSQANQLINLPNALPKFENFNTEIYPRTFNYDALPPSTDTNVLGT